VVAYSGERKYVIMTVVEGYSLLFWCLSVKLYK